MFFAIGVPEILVVVVIAAILLGIVKLLRK
jgi:Sec-independent protein translocase protein TatA